MLAGGAWAEAERPDTDPIWALPIPAEDPAAKSPAGGLNDWLLETLHRKAGAEIAVAPPVASRSSEPRSITVPLDIAVPLAPAAGEEPGQPPAEKLGETLHAYLGGWFLEWIGHRTGLIEGSDVGENFIMPTGYATWPADSENRVHQDFSLINVDIVPPGADGQADLAATGQPFATLSEDDPDPADFSARPEDAVLGGVPTPPLVPAASADTPDGETAPAELAALVLPAEAGETESAPALEAVAGDLSDAPADEAAAPVVHEKMHIEPDTGKTRADSLDIGLSLTIKAPKVQKTEIPAPVIDAVTVEDIPDSPKAAPKAQASGRTTDDSVGMLGDLADIPDTPAPAKKTKRGKAGHLASLGVPLDVLPKAPASPVRKLPDNVLALGETLHLGSKMQPPSEDPATRNHCVKKNDDTAVFCVEPVDWPSPLSQSLRVSSIMYQGAQAVVRYDGGIASRAQAIFPNSAYDGVIAYYTKRFGSPVPVPGNTIAPFAQPRQENPTVRWQRKDPDTGEETTLEIRKYDDTRGGFPDLRHSALMLYDARSAEIFPELSALDLMPTTGSN